jgi:hypothetical protein
VDRKAVFFLTEKLTLPGFDNLKGLGTLQTFLNPFFQLSLKYNLSLTPFLRKNSGQALLRRGKGEVSGSVNFGEIYME